MKETLNKYEGGKKLNNSREIKATFYLSTKYFTNLKCMRVARAVAFKF